MFSLCASRVCILRWHNRLSDAQLVLACNLVTRLEVRWIYLLRDDTKSHAGAGNNYSSHLLRNNCTIRIWCAKVLRKKRPENICHVVSRRLLNRLTAIIKFKARGISEEIFCTGIEIRSEKLWIIISRWTWQKSDTRVKLITAIID